MRRIRQFSVLLSMLAFAGLSLSPASAAPVCSAVVPAFCLDYAATVLSATTGQPTTQSLEPAALHLHFANTSANYRDEAGQARWLSALSATIASSGSIRPEVTPSAQLPDGLLLAGNPTGSQCGPGADSTFSGCTAGHGVAYAKITSSGIGALVVPTGVYTATYGIKQVTNVKSTSDLARFTITLGVCLQSGGNKCLAGEQVQSQDISIPPPTSGQPLTLSFTMPTGISLIGGVSVDRFTVDTLDLFLSGVSHQLADGTQVPEQTVLRLPASCGPVRLGATVTSVSGATVTLNQGLTITGCIQLTAALKKRLVGYPATAMVTGTVVDDNGAALPGRAITVKLCPVNKACTSARVATDSAGTFRYVWSPQRTTTVNAIDDLSHRSATQRVQVAPKIGLKTKLSGLRSGGVLTLSGAVAPAHPGATVVIQRQYGTAWRTIGTARISSKSTFAKKVRLTGKRGAAVRLRAVLPAHADQARGDSRPLTIRFR